METTTMTENETFGRDDGKPVFLGMKLEGTIENGVFVGSVVHRYHNPRDTHIEAVMTMYAPAGSVVSGLSCKLGDNEAIKAKVVESGEANERYEEMVYGGDMAAILEHSGDLRDVFSLSAGNLKPGESLVAEMKFSLELTQEGKVIRLTVPTGEIHKYGDQADLGRRDDQVPTMSHFVENPLEVDILVRGENATGRISTPNRKDQLQITKSEDGEELRISVGKGAFMDGDIILDIEPRKKKGLCYTLADREKGINYVMARLFVGLDEQTEETTTVKILVDNSASMRRGDIELARDFLFTFKNHLGNNDKCTLSMFGNHVDHVQPEPIRTDPRGKRLFDQFVSMQHAHMGGTELPSAVADIARLDSSSEMRDILIITDGAIGDYRGVISSARNHRCFIVGVGNAAHQVLEPIADQTGGKYFNVPSGADFDLVATQVYQSMRSAKATDIKVSWPTKPAWSVDPKNIWGNQSVDCFAAFKKMPEGEVTITYVQNDANHSYKLDLADSVTMAGLSHLAKGRRIEQLENTGKFDKALKLSVDWQILGRKTSLIFEHERSAEEKSKGAPDQVRPESMTPQGSFGTLHDEQVAHYLRMPGVLGSSPEDSRVYERAAHFKSRSHGRPARSRRHGQVKRLSNRTGVNMLQSDQFGVRHNSPQGWGYQPSSPTLPIHVSSDSLPEAPCLALPHRYTLRQGDELVANEKSMARLLVEFIHDELFDKADELEWRLKRALERATKDGSDPELELNLSRALSIVRHAKSGLDKDTLTMFVKQTYRSVKKADFNFWTSMLNIQDEIDVYKKVVRKKGDTVNILVR